MALGRKGLKSGAIKGLTVCCVCFTREICCCAEKYKVLYTGLSPVSFTWVEGKADRGETCM
ncbi:unnamed protein product [Staurois parvus]|uniref:Uncharacterized protein n=1 Tax=Staurois parvus TaxID=386267 RepID=A0ABN9HMY8_9NEOB|nr:unnamed protein product [Staurois parvus]